MGLSALERPLFIPLWEAALEIEGLRLEVRMVTPILSHSVMVSGIIVELGLSSKGNSVLLGTCTRRSVQVARSVHEGPVSRCVNMLQ